MGGNPVSACVLVRDGIATLERTVATYRDHVAEICVLDTGSTDGTLDLLDRLAGQPGAPIRVAQAEWRDDFAEARTWALEMAANDWALCIDADVELEGGEHLARNVARADRHNVSTIATWFRDPGPQPRFLHGCLLVNRSRGNFEGIVHEQWRPSAGGDWPLNPSAWICGDGLQFTHLRRRGVRHRPLLERAAADPSGTNTPRALFYYGLELCFTNRLPEAIQALYRYLAENWDACEGTPNLCRFLALENLLEAMRHVQFAQRRELWEWTSTRLATCKSQIPWRGGTGADAYVDIRAADGWLPCDGPYFGQL